MPLTCLIRQLRSAVLFGRLVGTLPLLPSLQGALIASHVRCACRLRKQRASSVSFPTPDTLLRRRPAESLRGALRHSRFVFRQVCQGAICTGILRHLTIRSSRPHVVASAMCFTLRLHTSAAPPRGGLTQALGGRKAFDCFAFQHTGMAGFGWHCSSVEVPGALLLRPSPSGALTHRMRDVGRLRKR